MNKEQYESIKKNVFPGPEYLLVKVINEVDDLLVGEIIRAHSTEIQKHIPLPFINKSLIIFELGSGNYFGRKEGSGAYLFIGYHDIIGYIMKDDNEENISGKKESN